MAKKPQGRTRREFLRDAALVNLGTGRSASGINGGAA